MMGRDDVKKGILADIRDLEAKIQTLRGLLQIYEKTVEGVDVSPRSSKQKQLPEMKRSERKPRGHFARIKLYFEQRNNSWRTAEQVAEDLGIPQASARDVLGRSSKEFFEQKQAHDNEPKFFRLKERIAKSK